MTTMDKYVDFRSSSRIRYINAVLRFTLQFASIFVVERILCNESPKILWTQKVYRDSLHLKRQRSLKIMAGNTTTKKLRIVVFEVVCGLYYLGNRFGTIGNPKISIQSIQSTFYKEMKLCFAAAFIQPRLFRDRHPSASVPLQNAPTKSQYSRQGP